MFSLKLALLSLLVASAAAQSSSSNSTQCDDAPLLCCTYSGAGGSDEMRAVGSALHMEVDPAKMYATGCSEYNPINVGGGTECTAAPVCCEDNYFGLLVGVGCTTIPVGV
ncbi:hypothetical protein CERSUDRAFT_115818 [Gelatoporia subvermispora B]|uniref:Hydrophobin n=1 Tax=Ceriporiopsis subvermispora (strain B) TaxID=914234 RepID=M2PID8_CERS8|nr:hypothetical protein CERSUDRAFT_115818 [Gelatoporia subvermispora B]